MKLNLLRLLFAGYQRLSSTYKKLSRSVSAPLITLPIFKMCQVDTVRITCEEEHTINYAVYWAICEFQGCINDISDRSELCRDADDHVHYSFGDYRPAGSENYHRIGESRLVDCMVCDEKSVLEEPDALNKAMLRKDKLWAETSAVKLKAMKQHEQADLIQAELDRQQVFASLESMLQLEGQLAEVTGEMDDTAGLLDEMQEEQTRNERTIALLRDPARIEMFLTDLIETQRYRAQLACNEWVDENGVGAVLIGMENARIIEVEEDDDFDWRDGD